jgi:hypothetical protein
MKIYSCFKYRPINKYLLDSLVSSELHFSSRTQINDPFDCNIDISLVVDRLVQTKGSEHIDLFQKFLSDSELIQQFQKNIDSLGIGSFSLELHETLMWSHYADDHKGVCIRYDFPMNFLDNEDEIMGVSKVSYEPNAVSDWLQDNIELFRDDHQKFIIGLLKNVLTSKAPSWKYEQEARIIRPITGRYEIPRKTMTRVIFGLQTSHQDEKLIRSIAEKYYDGVEFGRVVRTGDDFGIGTIKI